MRGPVEVLLTSLAQPGDSPADSCCSLADGVPCPTVANDNAHDGIQDHLAMDSSTEAG